jgi:hypothetical protein
MKLFAAACASGSSAEEPAAVTSPLTADAAAEAASLDAASLEAVSVEAASEVCAVDSAAAEDSVVSAAVEAVVVLDELPHPASIPAAISAAAETAVIFLTNRFFIIKNFLLLAGCPAYPCRMLCTRTNFMFLRL